MIQWITLFSVLVTLIPEAGAEGDQFNCLANETEVPLMRFMGGVARPSSQRLRPNSFRNKVSGNRVRAAYFLRRMTGRRRPFRVIFFNFTFTNQRAFRTRGVPANGGPVVVETIQDVPSVLTQGSGNNELQYFKRLLFVTFPKNPTKFTFFRVEALRVCVESNDPNPCLPAGTLTDFYHPAPNDPTMFIQCDDFGNAFLMPCAPGTQWNDGLNTCA